MLKLFKYFFFTFFKYIKIFVLREIGFSLSLNADKLLHVLMIFKFNFFFPINYLSDINVVDNISNIEHRFKVIYMFRNLKNYFRVSVEVFNNGLLSIPSINSFYPNSIWLEREIWDMFGVKFIFNFDMRRILTDYTLKGHPLRKDFPLLGFIEIRYDNIIAGIRVNPIKTMQSFRYFKYNNPWFRFS